MKYIKNINLNSLKAKIIVNYFNLLIYLILFQLIVQPFIYTHYSETYILFNSDFYKFNFFANIINSIIFGIITIDKTENIKLFFSILLFISPIILYIYDLEKGLFIISIYVFDIIINIFRILNKDKMIVLFTIINIVSITIFILFLDPYLSYTIVNFILFVSFLLLYFKDITNIKKTESRNNKKIILSVLNNSIKLSDRYIDKILFLSLNINTDKYHILPIIIVSGLIVMPLQLVGKILMSTHETIKVKYNKKFFFISFGVLFFMGLFLYFLLRLRYDIDVLNSSLFQSFFLIVIYKTLNAYNIIEYSNNYSKNLLNIGSIILYLVFALIFFLLYFFNVLLEINIFFMLMVIYFTLLLKIQSGFKKEKL